MKIQIDFGDWHELAEPIRQRLVCGQCAASTLVLWQKPEFGDRPRGTSLATIETDNNGQGKEHDVCYLVRCSFFKFNVERPEDIAHCEGFKAKEKPAE